ncbi:MAG TPA: bifunctional phosphopantothenoylcysteine decarboxylase/phosphopantothenate--cysteine ligase CoaBC [Gammaproteobacteria bacterium]|nr:bifunctional phosphopantothenoylcysteine decarboxylase/phosphopantothenate--cysteine ligase CoaBC [Gammaproteobacteria bacterium]
MNILKGKKIILGVTGSIAAYKSAELIRLLKAEDVEINVIMTLAANQFITEMTLQTLSGNRVLISHLDVDSEMIMSHIKAARSADLILIAPATAHCIAKLAAGFADDLLTTVCLAAKIPIIIAPAMNVAMWENSATQDNIKLLKSRNFKFLGPVHGIQACNETGEGRMLEPSLIAEQIQYFFKNKNRFSGKRVVITAGPTQEPIDPVRYISNRSSGKMGYAIAEAMVLEGADVVLISGPTALSIPSNVNKIDVTTAEQMFHAVMKYVSSCDIFIGCAAVSDYKISNTYLQKIKKSGSSFEIKLEPNPDILLTVSQMNPKPFLVGFAAETENLIEHAKQKLKNKNLNMIVANEVGETKGFTSDFNELVVLTSDDKKIRLEYKNKRKLAVELVNVICDCFINSSCYVT